MPPTKLNEEMLNKIKALKLLKISNKNIAIKLDINESTYYNWVKKGKKDYEEDRETIYYKFFTMLRKTDVDFEIKIKQEFFKNLFAKGDIRTMYNILKKIDTDNFGDNISKIEQSTPTYFHDVDSDLNDVARADLEAMRQIVEERESKISGILQAKRDKESENREKVKDLKFDE